MQQTTKHDKEVVATTKWRNCISEKCSMLAEFCNHKMCQQQKKMSILLPVSTTFPTPQTPMFSVFFSSIPGTLYVIKILLYIEQTGQIAQNHTRNQRFWCSNFEFFCPKKLPFSLPCLGVHHLDGGGGGHFRKHHHRALENLLFFPLCAFFLLRATQIQLITGFRISTPRSGTGRTNLFAGHNDGAAPITHTRN